MIPPAGPPRQDERGIVLIATAITVTVLIIAVSFAIDLGGRAQQKRQDHLVADLAALDAVPLVPVDAASVTLAANQSAVRNGGGSVVAVRGHWVASTRSFTPESVTACPCDAVKTTASSTYKDFFSPDSGSLDATAVAQPFNEASFLDGSTLVEVNAGLGKFGASLTAVGYNGLATGNVSLGALGTSLGFSALTADQILASQVKASDLVTASANLLAASSPTSSAALTALGSAMSLSATNNNKVTVGSALGLQTGNGTALSTSVNLLQAVVGGIQLANQKAGISGGLAVGLPGLPSATFQVTAIVPPTESHPVDSLVPGVGPAKPTAGYATATNAQVHVALTLNLTTVLGVSLGSISFDTIIGGATGDLTAADCPGGVPTDIQIGTTFTNVQMTVTSGTGIGNDVTGTVTIPGSAPVVTLNDPTNFVPGTPVSTNSSLGTPTISLSGAGLPLLGILTGAVFSTIIPTLNSTLKTAGVTVGNADYLGLQLLCGVGKLVA